MGKASRRKAERRAVGGPSGKVLRAAEAEAKTLPAMVQVGPSDFDAWAAQMVAEAGIGAWDPKRGIVGQCPECGGKLDDNGEEWGGADDEGRYCEGFSLHIYCEVLVDQGDDAGLTWEQIEALAEETHPKSKGQWDWETVVRTFPD